MSGVVVSPMYVTAAVVACDVVNVPHILFYRLGELPQDGGC